MDKDKQKVLQTYKFVAGFLENHHLNFFVACGSALGTARHKGFIPWDDDIDIYMLRNDYNKLLTLEDEMLLGGYKIVHLSNTENYYLKFAKVIDINTTLWETDKFQCLIGSFIDIFPLDTCNEGLQICARRWNAYDQVMNQYLSCIYHDSLGDILKNIAKGRIGKLKLWFYRKFKRKRLYAMKGQLIKMEKGFNREEGSYLMSYTETGQYYFPKEWFSDYVVMPFEDIQVRMPIGYHEYLTYMYGDYMQLPPEEKRISLHSHYYYNIEEGLDIKEVKRRLKKGERFK